MMKINLKNSNGISVLSLAIFIVVLVIITNIIIYSVSGNLKVANLKNMQNDIENLSGKIINYYSEYGAIPISKMYTNVEHLKSLENPNGEDIQGNFYVIDLELLDNLTLNYGKDYESIRGNSSLTQEEINRLKDIYIINEISYNIFYVDGIEIDNEVYYTNFTIQTKDTKAVELKYIDRIRIPEGYTYVSGNKLTGITIRNNSTSQIYMWTNVSR